MTTHPITAIESALAAKSIEHRTGFDDPTALVDIVEQLHNNPSLDNIEHQLTRLLNLRDDQHLYNTP